MSLTEDDLKAISAIMDQKIAPLRQEVRDDVGRLRNEMNQSFDHLYRQDEKREQEYLFVKEQLSRQEKQLSGISEQLSRHEQYFIDLDNRVVELEKQSA